MSRKAGVKSLKKIVRDELVDEEEIVGDKRLKEDAELQDDVNIEKIKEKVEGIDAELKAIEDEVFKHLQDLKRQEFHLQYLLNKAKMRKLKMMKPELHETVCWLHKNKHFFSKPIYDPIFITTEPISMCYAKYIENSISTSDMFTIVFEDKDDMNMFLRMMRAKKKSKVTCQLAPDELIRSYRPMVPLKVMKKYGVSAYLMDLFYAPEAVMAYLCQQYSVHKVAIGTRNSASHLEQLFNMKISKLFIHNTCYSDGGFLSPGIRKSVLQPLAFFNDLLTPDQIASFERTNIDLTDKISSLSNHQKSLSSEMDFLLTRQEELLLKGCPT